MQFDSELFPFVKFSKNKNKTKKNFTTHMAYAYRVLDDDSWAVGSQLVHCAVIAPDWQTSHVVDTLLCANIVDKSENLYTDDVVKIDDMLAPVM